MILIRTGEDDRFLLAPYAAMAKAKAMEDLIFLQASDDTEGAHARADEVLCDLLREMGFGDVVDAWDKIDKWYA